MRSPFLPPYLLLLFITLTLLLVHSFCLPLTLAPLLHLIHDIYSHLPILHILRFSQCFLFVFSSSYYYSVLLLPLHHYYHHHRHHLSSIVVIVVAFPVIALFFPPPFFCHYYHYYYYISLDIVAHGHIGWMILTLPSICSRSRISSPGTPCSRMSP